MTASRSTPGRGAARGAVRRESRRPREPAAGLFSVSLPAWRSKLLLFCLFCAFAALAARVAYLQGGGVTEFLEKEMANRVERNVVEAPTRGKILDRQGVVLAGDVEAGAIAVNPGEYLSDPGTDAKLARLLGLTPRELHQRVSENRDFVYLKRQLEPEVARAVEALHVPGLQSLRETRRVYLQGVVTAQPVGFTNTAGQGQEGFERAFDGELTGRPGLRHLVKDNRHHTFDAVWLREPVPGQDITLALDNRIQYVAHLAVEQAAQKNGARAACAVVLDARTGELLALANWPNFDPSHRDRVDPDQVRNRAVSDTFEPGSTLKPFSIATAIEKGIVRPDTMIDTSPGRMTIGGRTISDDHVHAELSVEQVVAKSSNVGTAKIALQMPAQALWDTLDAVGFGQVPRVGFSGAVTGRLRPADTWKPVEQATIAYGYGVSVSLLQLAHAYLAFARDGDIVPVSVLRLTAPPEPVPVFSKATADRMRRMLEMATSPEGTAPAARIAGYRVAGKTGTARKLVKGKYTDSYISSFVGFAPASDPRIVVAVMVDDPRAGRFYGGDVAAPAFGVIAAGALNALQVPPDDATVAQAPVARRG